MAHRGPRQAAEDRGRRAETLAAWWLRLKGYRILAQRFRGPGGEVDLIARRAGIIAFVEVKARADTRSAQEAVAPRQQARIIAAAQAFLARHPTLAKLDQRFDLIAVMPGRRPRHFPDAWRPW